MKRLFLESITASIFSIVFSCSIILELHGFISVPWLFWFSAGFILFLLLVNERVKVQYSYKLFAGEQVNRFVLAVTFLLSFTLSTLGAYFWTNKTDKQTNNLLTTSLEQERSIKARYMLQIDSLLNLSNQSPEFLELCKDIEYWKSRPCKTSEERIFAREKVSLLDMKRTNETNTFRANIETRVNNLKQLQAQEMQILENSKHIQKSDISRGAFVFWVFFSLVCIAEIMIIFIQYQRVTFYSPAQRRNLFILADLIANKPEQVRTNLIKYHKHMQSDFSHDENKAYQHAISLITELTNLQIIDKDGFWLNMDGLRVLTSYYSESKRNF